MQLTVDSKQLMCGAVLGSGNKISYTSVLVRNLLATLKWQRSFFTVESL